jgi:predicted RNA-binding protein with PUA-like domain
MDEQVARTIGRISTLEGLAQFESNARRGNALTDEMKGAIKLRSAELGRTLVAERTGLDLGHLTLAEEKIVEAVSEYVGIMKRQGKDATRTLSQIRNRGLLEAAEAAVAKATPTQGFQTLADADLANLSYEQIIVDHSDEFSPRALWFARRTLGLLNDTERPPAKAAGPRRVDAPYWVFVCNPKKWAIDRFLDRSIEHDTWGIRPSDHALFAPGQLGIVRVGVDRRSLAERNGHPPLAPGIYALCEVESKAFPGTGANDEFWADDEGRAPGWPTVKLRYLRTYLNDPLTIERLRAERPNVSKLLLNGFQGASFPIQTADFQAVMALLDERLDELPPPERAVDLSKLAALEEKYLHASPEIKERLSQTIERGPIGALVKQAIKYKCQVCAALGQNPIAFMKPNGEPYVEAHHVSPVSRREVGSLSSSNVMVVCPNHHRQLHYGGIEVAITPTAFELVIDGHPLKIHKVNLADRAATNAHRARTTPTFAGGD